MHNARERFLRNGYGIAALTYDNVATLRDFAARMKIGYPLLADPDSAVIRAFRMLDPDNSENNVPAYGAKNVAYPGWFLIDPKGVVRDRFIDGNWNDRFTAGNVFLAMFPELAEIRGQRQIAPHIAVEPVQSDASASPGSRVTLGVDVFLPKDVHVYAPGAAGYKVIALEFEGGDEFTTRPARYPRSKTLHLKAIKEKAPVFEGQFRITQDVVISDRGVFQRTLPGSRDQSREVVIRAKLKYQACDSRECFRPSETPVEWKLNVHRNDGRRPAKENQKPVGN